MDGWYYLHVNGDLIFKRDLDGTAADIRESDFAVAMWPCDLTDRESAWRICVEASAAGANIERINELIEKWECNDEDADIYAERIGCLIRLDGDQWVATRKDFVNLQESPAGFGNTKLQAMANLAKALGYKPSKMWTRTFKDLLS
jgi:hypothetical protein